MPHPAPRLVDPEDSVLYLIDVQAGFLSRLPETTRTGVLGRIRFLVEVAGRLGIPVFTTVEDPARNGATDPLVRSVLPEGCLEHDKRVFGLMGQPDLAELANASARRTAVLVGLETDVCVLHSGVGLAGAGWRVVLVSDACAAPSPAHEAGLARARELGLETAHAKGLYYEWIRSLAGLARIAAAPAIRPPADLAL